MKLRLLIISILLAGYLYPQNFDWDWFGKGKRTTVSPAIIPTAQLDLTTGAPIVPYDNLCLKMTPPQVLKFIHNRLLDLSDSTVELLIQWDMQMSNFPLGNSSIFGQNHNSGSYKTIIWLYSASNAFHLKVKDTTYDIYTHNNNQAWHTYKLWYHAGNLEFYVDTDSVYGRATNFANPDTTFYSQAFSWGAYSEFWDTYIYNDAGTLTGHLDNIYVKASTTNITDSIVSNTNFNSYTQMPHNAPIWYVWDRNGGPHPEIGQLFSGSTLGNSGTDPDFFDPQFVWRSGQRKDTCMYVQLGDSAGGNGLVTYSSATSYVRAGGVRAFPNPNDSTEVAVVGFFTHTRDSAHPISNDMVLYHSATDRFDSCSKGMQVSGDFTWWVAYKEDSIFVVHTNDTVGGNIYAPDIAKYVRGLNKFYPLDTLHDGISPKKCLLYKDSIWVMSGKYLYAWADSSWHMKDSFVVSAINVPTFFCSVDSFYVSIPGEGIYNHRGDFNHILTATHNGYASPPAYSKGSIYYSGDFYDAETDGFYLGGDFDTLGGVYCNGIAYYKHGRVSALGKGADGVYWGQGDPITVGMWNRCVVAITKWQGEIIATGNFRYMDSVNIGSNIAMYNPVDGWRALDYGIDWRGQGMCVYNVVKNDTTYKRLMIVGDFSSAGGIPVGHIVSRLSQAEQLTIVPQIDTFTAQVDIPLINYPPTINIWAHSHLRRAITATVTYQINGGVTKSFTMSHSDSSLVIYRGTWFFKWTGAFGASDTVANNDTITYTATFLDDRGNSVDTSDTFLIIYPDYPATPTYIWDWQDLIDSIGVNDSVFAWANEQDTLTLRGPASRRPKMTATGLLWDTTDYMNAIMPHLDAGGAMTIITVMKVVDTNSANPQRFWGYRNNSPNIKELTFQITTNAVSTYRKLGTTYYQGAFSHKTFLTNVGNHFNTFSVFTVYTDSLTNQNLDVNDITAVNQGAPFSTGINNVCFYLGDGEGSGGMKDVIIKRVIIYFRLLNDSELTQAYNASLARP